MRHYLSLSGGKDSTALMLMMLEKDMPLDAAFFFDGGWEWPQIYEHLDKLERNTGVSIIHCKPDKDFNYWMFDHVMTKGKRKGERGYGWPRSSVRWCTELKTRTVGKVMRQHAAGDEFTRYVGIAADEAKRATNKKQAYPLIDWSVTEADALSYCLAHGYDFGGLYETRNRISCWCCPLQTIGELRDMCINRPELWAELVRMDDASNNQLKHYTTLRDIERECRATS